MIKADRRAFVSRRHVLQSAGALLAHSILLPPVARATESTKRNRDVLYGQDTLPIGIRSRRVDTNNGVTLHILESGFESPNRPCVVLLHGYPELAYIWRNQLLPLAQPASMSSHRIFAATDAASRSLFRSTTISCRIPCSIA